MSGCFIPFQFPSGIFHVSKGVLILKYFDFTVLKFCTATEKGSEILLSNEKNPFRTILGHLPAQAHRNSPARAVPVKIFAMVMLQRSTNEGSISYKQHVSMPWLLFWEWFWSMLAYSKSVFDAWCRFVYEIGVYRSDLMLVVQFCHLLLLAMMGQNRYYCSVITHAQLWSVLDVNVFESSQWLVNLFSCPPTTCKSTRCKSSVSFDCCKISKTRIHS